MRPGRKLDHIQGMRFDSLNSAQWRTYLFSKHDWETVPNRRTRWKHAWEWMLGDRTHTWGKPFN